MAKKNERELKVCAQSGYNYKSVPAIRLMGQWLEAAGFHIGDPVLVKCVDTEREELIEAEKAFLEKETRKLHERFLKEKKELHAQFVAERQAECAKDRERGKAYV